ncbi:MAG: MFS transporter [Kofleriaceae bacterium]
MTELTTSRRRGFLLILALSGFVTSFGAHVVAVNLPDYAKKVGVGALMIGLLIAVYDVAELFAKPVTGLVADRRGMRIMLVVGLIVFVLGSLLFLVLPPQLLLVVRFVQGLGAAALSTVSIALVGRFYPKGRGRAFGIYNAVKGAGYVLAPTAGAFLATRHGFDSVFVASAGLGGLALGLAFVLPNDRPAPLEEEDEPSFKQLFALFTDPALLPIYAAIVINMFVVGVLFGFFPVYLHAINYSTSSAGLLVSATTASYLLVQPLAGWLADKVDPALTIIVGLVVAAGATLGIPAATGWPLIPLAVAAGLGVGTVWTNTDTLVVRIAGDRQLGAAVGAAQSFKEVGDMLGPLAIGAIAQVWGVRVGFIVCGAAALVVVAVFAFHSSRRAQGRGSVRRSML